MHVEHDESLYSDSVARLQVSLHQVDQAGDLFCTALYLFWKLLILYCFYGLRKQVVWLKIDTTKHINLSWL